MGDHNILSGRNVCYVGVEVKTKETIKGFDLDSYYIQEMLRSTTNLNIVDITSRKRSDIKSLISSDVIWVDYPIARFAGFLVLLILLILRKELILRIRDLPVEQARDIYKKERSCFFNFQLKTIEKLMVWKAKVIVSSSPGFINYINPRTSQVIVFPHGVCKDELKIRTKLKKGSDKYILAYAGSLDRGGMIEKLSSMFSEFKGWEFWIAGRGSEDIAKNKNTKYFGFLKYLEVQEFYEKADAIVIPYPDKEYYRICVPLKIGEVLATCKPVITLKYQSLDEYLKYINLENNIIYVNNWSEREMEEALVKAKMLEINVKDTINRLSKITWEDRIINLMNEIDVEYLDELDSNHLQLKWI